MAFDLVVGNNFAMWKSSGSVTTNTGQGCTEIVSTQKVRVLDTLATEDAY